MAFQATLTLTKSQNTKDLASIEMNTKVPHSAVNVTSPSKVPTLSRVNLTLSSKAVLGSEFYGQCDIITKGPGSLHSQCDITIKGADSL